MLDKAQIRTVMIAELQRQGNANFGIVVGEVEGDQLMVDGYVDIDALVEAVIAVAKETPDA